jgi:hypothetical protein
MQSQTHFHRPAHQWKIRIEVDIHVGSTSLRIFTVFLFLWLFPRLFPFVDFFRCSPHHSIRSLKAVDQMVMFLRFEWRTSKQEVNAALDGKMVGIRHEKLCWFDECRFEDVASAIRTACCGFQNVVRYSRIGTGEVIK